jgi:hypothetical protein
VEICAIRRASLKACATPMRRFTRRSRLRRMPGKWTAQQWKRCWARSRNSNRPFINSFIYPSGCGVLGNTGDKVADEDTPLAPTPMVAWRPANERLVLEAARQGVQGVVLRPAKVYARGGGLVASFTQSAREQGAARMIGDGENRWTFVRLDDLAPGGQSAQVAGWRRYRSRGAPKKYGPFADALALDQQISGQRAQRVLGWRPEGLSVLEELAGGR